MNKIDPLFHTIDVYWSGKRKFEALPDSAFTSQAASNEIIAMTYGPAQDALMSGGDYTPPVTSLKGVQAAIKLTLMEDAVIDIAAENALRSALAYLDQHLQ